MEASKKMPPRDARLETADSTYYHFKSDIFNRQITYSTDKSLAANLVTISADRALEIIAMNKAGEKPLSLKETVEEKPRTRAEFGDILGEDDLTRFDKKKKKRKNKQAAQKGPKPEGQAPKGPKPEGQTPKAPKAEGQPEAAKPENKAQRPPKPATDKDPRRNKGTRQQKQSNNNPRKPDTPAGAGRDEQP